MTTAVSAPAIPALPAAALAQVQALYDAGLLLQAYELGKGYAPLAAWQPAEAQVLAGRLVAHLGAPRLSRWLHRCAYRAAPQLAEAQYFYALSVAHSRGPYAAWQWLSRRPIPESADAELRSSWYGLLGNVAATLRDFEAAGRWIALARETDPTSAWVLVCVAALHEAEDRYEEALAAAQGALALRPWYRPAVQAAAHYLTLLGRDDEALNLLREANRRLESGVLTAQQFAIELEMRDFAAASQSLERTAELWPLVEKEGREFLAAQRADVAYHLGDTAAAIHHARESNSEYWKAIADRLEDPARADGQTVLLPVGFVRQHHMTCGPATLAAISRYWQQPADHLQIADEICYSGTSHYNERKWATDHGWIAREFSVTESSAVALLERGIPFTFTTVEPASAHLQALIGFDGRRGTLSVRDPYFRNSGEPLADKLLSHYRPFGPRGMALVPLAEAARLEGIDLPDVALWDQLHALDGALNAHRREAAGAIVSEMNAAEPAHRLTLEARRRLGVYDGNPSEQLAAVDALAVQFPDDQTVQYYRLALLRDHSRREERLALFESLLAKKETHPVFGQQYAQELRADARRHEEAIWRLGRAIRRWPREAANYQLLGSIYWDQRRFEEALLLYRLAACLADKEEFYVDCYFRAACWFKQAEQVLELLRNRFERLGKQSHLPATSLVSALLELDRTPEALAVLDRAIELRPNDGELMLYAADILAASNTEHLSRSRELLERAQDKSAPGRWLRTAANLKQIEGDLLAALALWQKILQLAPRAIDAHRAVARLLAETTGPVAALSHLAAAAERFPHYYPLYQLWAEWLRGEPLDQREPVLRRITESFPHDAWAHRELGFLLADARRLDEAWQSAATAERLEPRNPSIFLLQAMLHTEAGEAELARAALRSAIELGVDNEFAIRELVALSPTPDERRAALAFVKQELIRQVTFGDGLLTYREQARGTLEPAELLALLRQALAERPDLWHAWSATVQQLLAMNELDEAWSLIQQATQRFPLLARLWINRADVCRARHDFSGEMEAYETAYHINPRWNTAIFALSAALERRGDYPASRELLQRSVARLPLDGGLRGLWAEALWRDKQREAALAEVEKLIQLDPGYERAWDLLRAWSAELNCHDRALTAARELTQHRGGEARSWLALATLLDKPEESAERMAALDKAVSLAPRTIDAHDQRAVALAEAGRWEDALAACRPAALGEHPPTELRWRAAWIEFQRGNLPAAIDRLRQLLADEPRCFAAWMSLADWYAQLQDNDRYLEAAEAMVAISPQYEMSHGYLADALHRRGDKAGARRELHRAFALNPQYEFAGNALFDMELEEGDLVAAAQTVERLRAHSDSPFVLAREAQLAAKNKQTPKVLEVLEQLARQPGDNTWPLQAAVDALVEAGQADQAEAALERLFTAEGVNPIVGRLWIGVQLRRQYWCGGQRLQELLATNAPIGEQAVYAYVDGLARVAGAVELNRFLKVNAFWLTQNVHCWGAGGYALTLVRDYASTARWMRDWRQRPDAKPWMLVNTAEGLREIGRRDEAREVSQAALAMPPDNGTPLHKLWLASDAAAVGDASAAAQLISGVDRQSLDADYQFLATCVTAVLDMAGSSVADRPQFFRDAYGSLCQARRSYPHLAQERARRRVYRRCLWQVGKLRGGWLARLRCAFEWVLTF